VFRIHKTCSWTVRPLHLPYAVFVLTGVVRTQNHPESWREFGGSCCRATENDLCFAHGGPSRWNTGIAEVAVWSSAFCVFLQALVGSSRGHTDAAPSPVHLSRECKARKQVARRSERSEATDFMTKLFWGTGVFQLCVSRRAIVSLRAPESVQGSPATVQAPAVEAKRPDHQSMAEREADLALVRC
jgi:hypothetical protein